MNQEEWIAELKGIQPALFEGLRRMVAIPSIRGEAEDGAPFGKGPRRALDEVLAIASELGFQTKNIDNKIGYAQYGEDRPDGAYYGIFGHVDVMPLGEGWISPALELTVRDGRLYGRGTLDNKGPILSNLYALYVLKEKGVTFDRPVRIVFGAASNIENFSFVVATSTLAPTVFRVHPQSDGTMRHELATKEWLEAYLEERMKPLEVKE